MTQDDFNEWFAFYAARFAGVGDFLAKKKDQHGGPLAQRILAAWFDIMADVDLADAKAATNELFNLPEKDLPRGFDRHPPAIRLRARAMRSSRSPEDRRSHRVDGQETFRCLICRDAGAFIVWHPVTITLIREGKGQPMLADPRMHPAYTCAVRCDCGARGNSWLGTARDGRKLATIDRYPTLEALVVAVENQPVGFEEFRQFSGTSPVRPRGATDDPRASARTHRVEMGGARIINRGGKAMAKNGRAKVKSKRPKAGTSPRIPPSAEVDPSQFGLGGPGHDIALDLIDAGDNPRSDFDEKRLDELAASVRANGILQPLIVRPCTVPIGAETKRDRRFVIVAGERRWRAARLAGLKAVPCVVRDVSDEQARRIALIENLQREDLNPIEEARGLQAILEADDGPTQRQLASQVGKSQAWIANRLRLLELPESWMAAVISREITERHARAALAWIEHPQILQALLRKIENALAAGDPVTVEIFEQELLPEVVKSLTRTMDGRIGDGLIFDAKRNRWVRIFDPTVPEAKELGIVEVCDESRATNVDLWEKLQAAFLADEEERDDQVTSTREMMAAAADADRTDKESEGRSSADRPSPKKGLPSGRLYRCRQAISAETSGAQSSDSWRAKLYAWKISWVRWLIARALRQHDATYVSDRLAILAIGDWDLIGWAPDADDAIQARIGKRGWKNCATAIWKVPEHDLPKVLDDVLAELFWRESVGEIDIVPPEQCEAILKAMEIELEMQWSLEQAGELSEAYWRLHIGVELVGLAKELGVDHSIENAPSYDALVEAFLARKPSSNDTAAEQGEKVLNYPKELKRLKATK